MRIKMFWVLVAMLAVAMMVVSCGGDKNKNLPPVTEAKPQTDNKPVEPQTPAETRVETPQLTEAQFQTVYFDFDRYSLRNDAKCALDANAALLKQYPNVRIQIEGHCDERGTVEYNLSLGEKRARSCMEYLTGLGIGSDRVGVISFGEERPAMAGSNEDAWSRNRRAEFKITSQAAL